MRLLHVLFSAAFVLFTRPSHADDIVCDTFLQVSFWCTTISILGSNGDEIGESVMDVMAAAINNNNKPAETIYDDSTRIFCVDNNRLNIPIYGEISLDGLTGGGICAFVEGGSITLARVRELTEILIRNSCNTCGNIPVDYPNGQDSGRLKFDYVTDDSCQGNCITANDLITCEGDCPVDGGTGGGEGQPDTTAGEGQPDTAAGEEQPNTNEEGGQQDGAVGVYGVTGRASLGALTVFWAFSLYLI